MPPYIYILTLFIESASPNNGHCSGHLNILPHLIHLAFVIYLVIIHRYYN